MLRSKTQADFVEANRAGAAFIAEEIVRELMGDTSDSTQDEDKYDDIDFWYHTSKRVKLIPVSVKYMRAAERTGRVAFELEVTYDDDKILMAEKKWFKSWYYNGRARYYAIIIGNRVLIVNKAGLEDYVNTNGWLKVVTLSAAAKLSQTNHVHKDSKSGLVCIETIVQEGFAHWQYQLTDEQVNRLTTQAKYDSLVTNQVTQQNKCTAPIPKLRNGYTNPVKHNHKIILPTGGTRWTATETHKPEIETSYPHDG